MSLPVVQYHVIQRRKWEEHLAKQPDDTWQPPLRPSQYSPNYGFYIGKVCLCAVPVPEWATEYNKFTANDSEVFHVYTCKTCGLFDPVSFKRCPNCDSAFYDMFRHPNQTRSFHLCWNCLESGVSTIVHPLYSRYTKHPPPDELLAPPVTDSDREAGEDSFMQSLKSLLAD